MFLARPEDRSKQAPRRPRILAQIGLTVFTVLAAAAASAQGVRYTVKIEAPSQIEELLENNLDLVHWRDNPRLDRDQLQRLVKNTADQVRTLVATEGYYSPVVSTGLDTSGAEPVARVIVDPGQPVLVGDVDLVLRGFEPLSPAGVKFDAESLRRTWSLPVGRRFRQADWELAKRNLLRQVMQVRYPRAQLAESSATVDPEVHRALLHVVIDSGPEVRLGGLRIEGLQRYPAAIINNLNQIKPGDEYNETVLQEFQARLQGTGYFSGVEVSADMSELLDESIQEMTEEQKAAAPKPAAAAAPVTTPVLVRVTENKQKNVVRRPRLFDQYRQPRAGELRRPVGVRPAHEEQYHPRDLAPDRAHRLLLPHHAERLQRQHRRRLRAQRRARRTHQRVRRWPRAARGARRCSSAA